MSVAPEIRPTPRRVGRDTITTVAFRGAALPASFAISLITSRYLLPAGRGAFTLSLLTVTLAATLLGNIGVAVTYELGKARERASMILTHGLVLAVALGVVGGGIVLAIDLSLADRAYRGTAFAALALPAMLATQVLSGALLALGRIRLWNVLQVLLPFATLIGLLVVVVALHRAAVGAVAAWALAQVVVTVAGLVATRRLWWRPRLAGLTFARIRPILFMGLRVGLANLVSLVNYRVELVLLELYQGLHAVGIYSLAVSLGELLWLASSALATATVAPAVAADDDRQAAAVVARSARHALLVTVVLAAIVAAIAGPAVPFVFGHPFRSSTEPLLLLLPGIVLFAPGSIFAVYFSMRRGKTRYPVAASVLSMCVTSVAAVLLIPGHGASGAAVASTVGYGIAMLAESLWFSHSSGVGAGALVPRVADLATYRRVGLGLLRR